MLFLENLKRRLLKLTENQKFVFLIKSDDHTLNSYFITHYEDVFENILFVSQHEYLLTQQENSTSTLAGKDARFIDIQTITQALVDNITGCITAPPSPSAAPCIYFLPKEIIYRFIDQKSIEKLLYSSLFLSEELAGLRPQILKERIQEIYQNEIPDSSLEAYLSKLSEKQKYSLDKLSFFASLVKQNYYGTLNFGAEIQANHPTLDTFLNQRGIEFVNYFSNKVPLGTIEGFFRSFLDVRSDTFITKALTYEEAALSLQIKKEDLTLLLEMATSPDFNILQQEHGYFMFKTQEYLEEWEDLHRWIQNEKESFKQYRQLEMLAKDYFKAGGTLLSKEQIEQALHRGNENPEGYHWEEKYQIDKALISSYIKLSQDNLEEAIKKQQKKRARLLKNSIRISIAVSIAFLLSSFTALIAYLERNSAIKQQELAMIAKEEADKARATAETQRMQAELAKQNESIALKKAEIDRMIAIESQGQAEEQRQNALVALDMAEKSAQEASMAREVAEKNEGLARDAQEEALINYRTSERLRNQQEARASSLEALRYYDNADYEMGFKLALEAFEKNIQNGGFPLQSDIFLALLYAKLSSEKDQLAVQLEHPGKLIALSNSANKLGVFTIDGYLHVFTTKPSVSLNQSYKVGTIQYFAFKNDSRILYTDLEGQLFELELGSNRSPQPQQKLSDDRYKSIIPIPNQSNTWAAIRQDGGFDLIKDQQEGLFVKVKENSGGMVASLTTHKGQLIWAEKNQLFGSDLSLENKKLLATVNSEISSIEWSDIHSAYILGLVSGHLMVIDPAHSNKASEPFLIHESKINRLKIVPYSFDTELLVSTGYDGSLYLFTLHKDIPFSSSVSSRINLPKHRSWITGFVTDPAHKLAYSVSNDRSLKIWPFAIEGLLKN